MYEILASWAVFLDMNRLHMDLQSCFFFQNEGHTRYVNFGYFGGSGNLEASKIWENVRLTSRAKCAQKCNFNSSAWPMCLRMIDRKLHVRGAASSGHLTSVARDHMFWS